jgi:FdhD protein
MGDALSNRRMQAVPVDLGGDGRAQAIALMRVDGQTGRADRDVLTVEEPLEIRVSYASGTAAAEHVVEAEHNVAVTMRTPGDDYELAAGFLLTEGFIDRPEQLRDVSYCGHERNVVRATLLGAAPRESARGVDGRGRELVASASCGVCGKASIAEVMATVPARLPAGSEATPAVAAAVLHRLPDELRRHQATFDRTGGLHAAALFDAGGRLLRLREDVGRHNALDKLIGHAVLAGTLPLHDAVVLFSGRTGFELVQKAACAGIRFLAAVGAPSSLACELAAELDITLVGFLRDGRCNIYTGAGRVTGTTPVALATA